LEKFPENASWSIASSLPPSLPATSSCPYNITLIVPPTPLRVAYAQVAAVVPKLLATQEMVLHIGLAAGRNFFTMERQAQRGPYNKFKDVDGKLLPDSEAERLFDGCPETLQPTFDCDDVWKRWRYEVDDETADLRQGTDTSVGLYLCGFVYYLSLSWFWKKRSAERPVIFLHVPDLPTEDDVAQGTEIAIGLIRAMVASRKKNGIRDFTRTSVAHDEEMELALRKEDDVYQGV
jgi:pyrrolidone-carboxylate peptidase